MRKFPILILAVALLALWWWLQHATPQTQVQAPAVSQTASAPTVIDNAANAPQATAALPGFLPPEAHATLRLIAQGGPFPHRQDGSVFGNREKNLPQRPRGWYHEYTVETPGLNHRGTRRIVTGGTPPSEYWYTDDHYESFRRFDYLPSAE
ncbi:MAG: ribonuclease domain-containing protein [Pseudoxanthomonas sp.]